MRSFGFIREDLKVSCPHSCRMCAQNWSEPQLRGGINLVVGNHVRGGTSVTAIVESGRAF